MKIGILVTDFEVKKSYPTTIRLAREALNLGHEVFFLTPGGFTYTPHDHLRLRVISPPRKRYKSSDTFMKELAEQPVRQTIDGSELDVLLLRDNPAKYSRDKNWAKPAGTTFGRAAVREGIIVLNDPDGLNQATNKMYFQGFPEPVRPKTLITRDLDAIKDFARELEGDLILKPLQGSGGDGVFMVKKDANYNLNQMVEALLKDGFIIAQEYLTAAEKGDVRLYMMNGRPLRVKGKYAAFQRVRSGDDIRSNMHAGGTIEKAEVTTEMLDICEMVRPKLVKDGMFLVGLDIVGNKLMEINVFCPGGLQGMEKLEGVNFSAAVVEALDRKVRYSSFYDGTFDNVTMATL